MIHKAKNTNVYRCLPIKPLPVVEGYQTILDLWDSKRADNLLPARSSFTFEDFAGWYGSIAISVIEGDDMRFSLYGSNFVECLGVDLTKELLCESMDQALIAQTRAYFHDLIEGPYIGHMTGHAPTEGRDFVPFDVLDLPLSDDGVTVDRFLHAILLEE